MGKQKVLIVHNYYQLPGGEDTVVANEKQLLEAHGHETILYTRHNSELREMNVFRKILLPFSTIFNLRTYREIRKIIKKEKIDIVHVHNTLNLISPSVYYAALGSKVPVVQTIHNFRLLCPGATFYRDGKICEDCLNKGLGCAIKNKCYRNSRIQTLACVISLLVHRWTGVYGKIHYICLTDFNKEKLLLLKQIPESHVFVKPNFAAEREETGPAGQRTDRIIYVGRLEELKGVHILLEAWKLLGNSAPELLLCGTGPLEPWCKDYIRENRLNATMKGFVPNEAVRSLIGSSCALVLPTQCYESFPMTIAEAFAEGTPVITGNMGNAGSLVEDGITGVKYRYDDPSALADAVRRSASMAGTEMVAACRKQYENTASPEGNYRTLCEIYSKTGNEKR